jgi:predicted secreted protein
MNKPLFILILFCILAGCTGLEEAPCKISDIEITLGECQTDSTYNFTLDFVYSNVNNEYFEIFGRENTSLGYYNLADLPLNIEDFKMSNKDYDYIKICINDNPDCCAEHEFIAPDCSHKTCEIRDLVVTPEDCTTEGKYNLTIDFIHENAGNEFFEVFGRKNAPLGYFKLTDLPLTIENFETSGNDYDFIKICINDNADCCEVSEFIAPDCSEQVCEIRDLSITTSDCITDGKYNLTIDFIHENANNEYFDVFGNGAESLGYFKLSDLPLTIENYVTSGNDYDRIKVCINDNPDCCSVNEFLAPDCSEKACEIRDLELIAGDCATDSTYQLTINFNHQNTNNSLFEVFTRNNNYIGIFELADLPITLPNFKKSGLEYDFIKVAINDNLECWKAEEIKSPTCKQ